MNALLRTPLLLAAALLAGPALAAKGGHENVRFSPAHFEAQREAIIEGISGETYRELSDEDRATVLEALTRMQDRLAGVDSLEQLDKRDQTAVFNDQDLVNTLLTEAAADSRLVCKREKFVGSNRTTNVCITVGERKRLAEAAQNQMRGMQGSGYLEPEGAAALRARGPANR